MNRDVYYKYFEEKIKPLVYPLEQERVKTVKRVVFSSVTMFLCGIICAYVFIILSLKNNMSLLLLPVVLFLMYTFFIKSIIDVMYIGREYQKTLVQQVLPYFFEPAANFKHWPKNHDIVSFLNSGLFGNFENREDDMAFFGIYKNTNITISNTKLTIPVNRVVFQGVTIQLELEKSIDNHVIFISKNEHKRNVLRQINPHIDELNKYLYTFSENNNTDFITEEFWYVIKRIGEAYTAKGFELSYKDKTLLIALSSKKPFKFGFLFKSLLKSSNYDELIDMFLSVFDLVDLLTNPNLS